MNLALAETSGKLDSAQQENKMLQELLSTANQQLSKAEEEARDKQSIIEQKDNTIAQQKDDILTVNLALAETSGKLDSTQQENKMLQE